MAKGFFAPSWDFFSWVEIKSVISTSISLAWKTARELLRMPSLALLFIVTAVMSEYFGSEFWQGVVKELVEADPPGGTKLVWFLLFLYFLVVAYHAVSRVLLVMNRLSGYDGRSAGVVAVRENEAARSFGLRLAALGPVYFSHLFILFMDVRSKEKSSWPSIKRSFWMGWRLLPSLIPMIPIACVLLTPTKALVFSLNLVLAYLHVALAKITELQYYIAARAVCGLVAPIALLINLALQYTIYTRIFARHSDLIFQKSPEESNEQD